MKKTVDEVIKNSNIIVIGNKTKEFESILHKINRNKHIVDLVRIYSNPKERNGYYDGICW
jgi:hypothetical protein